MHDEPLQVTDQPAEADWQFVEERINSFNLQQTGYSDYRPLAIFVRDAAGAIIAGITAYTWGGTLRVSFLWVHEDYRKHGYGRRLLQAAELEAIARGCTQANLDTHSFQAPDFYVKVGYSLCGLLENYPVGYHQAVFQKQLTP